MNTDNMDLKHFAEFANKSFQWVLSILMAIIAWQGVRILDSIGDHERRLTTIEASRYTAKNAVQDQRAFLRDVNASIKELRTENIIQFQQVRDDIGELRQQ
jgi:hypothetical protein